MKHPEAGEDIFIGNITEDRMGRVTKDGLVDIIRFGKLAYDIEGKPLPEHYKPMFVKLENLARYDRIITERLKDARIGDANSVSP